MAFIMNEKFRDEGFVLTLLCSKTIFRKIAMTIATLLASIRRFATGLYAAHGGWFVEDAIEVRQRGAHL